MLRFLFLIIVLWHTQTLNHLSLERFFLIRIRHTQKKEWTKKDIWIANFHLWLRTCYHTAFSHNTQDTTQSYVSFLRNKLWWVCELSGQLITTELVSVCLSVCLLVRIDKKRWKKEMKNKFDTFHLFSRVWWHALSTTSKKK